MALNTRLIGANLSEERFFPEPLSKDFIFVFSEVVHCLLTIINCRCNQFMKAQYHLEKNQMKVLGREFEGEPFFKRVSLNEPLNYLP